MNSILKIQRRKKFCFPHQLEETVDKMEKKGYRLEAKKRAHGQYELTFRKND
jgi:hypothetical protein